LVPQTDKAWAKSKEARKAIAKSVPRSKVRNTMIMMIFTGMVIVLPGMRGQEPSNNEEGEQVACQGKRIVIYDI
jgi:hypothetical protein